MKKLNLFKSLVIASFFFLQLTSVQAQNPILNLQGVLRDQAGNVVADGSSYQLTLFLFSQKEGGDAIWNETHNNVQVINGVYSLEVGDVSTLGGLPFNVPYYLGISVNGGQVSSPRIPLSLSPYALSVRGVTNSFPSDGNVTIGSTQGDNKLEVVNGQVEIQNEDMDSRIRFHDPHNVFMVIGLDQSDGHKFKIGYGAELGAKDFVSIEPGDGTTTLHGRYEKHEGMIMQDLSTSDNYNVWLQGNRTTTSRGDDRNLALLGTKGSHDKLYVNYDSEYQDGTQIGGPVNVAGSLLTNGHYPIVIRSYDCGTGWAVDHNTGMKVDEYSAVIVGSDWGYSDWQEDHSGWIFKQMMVNVSDYWHIRARARLHGNTPHWHFHVMFIRRELVSEQRSHWGWW
jgi:hypothetical protein